MKRVIKFRAFLKNRGYMTPVYLCDFGDNSIQLLNSFNGMTTYYPDEYELMQFTGLLDKNGNEIFEGDIVKGWNTNLEVTCINGAFGYTTKAVWKEFQAFTTHNHLSINDGLCKQLEVIGNIYEHPDLLKQ